MFTADGDGSSLTASLSDAHGEESPLPIYTEIPEANEAAENGDEENPTSAENPEHDCDGGNNASPGPASQEAGGEEATVVGAEGVGGEGLLDGDLSPEDLLVELSLEGTKALEGGSYSSSTDVDAAGEEDGAGAGAGNPGSSRKPTVARSLFGSGEKAKAKGRGGGGKGQARKRGLGAEGGGGGDKARSSDAAPIVPSKEELKLQSR